ncbi:hypothetical protein RA19_16590 [Leisingera sp. ANG-M1]|uniref:hypothetical protein n=1 Tax=Leisingera sp. ANG-M1 TaxID=1577895 RepID=UPI00057E2651|nr:hypothetical protein [Leisingera sp. ANG-M1]KIC09317.1 hypothetical protein RA19_16590 [Leisingera sp. ANG-M1]
MALTFDRFATGPTYEDLPEQALWTFRRSFLGAMGVTAIGATTELSKTVRRVAPLLSAPAA